MVNAVVQEWLRQVLTATGYGNFVRTFLSLFYANDVIIAGRDTEQVQESLNIIANLFERVGLRPNTTKTVQMVCVPGRIRTRLTTSTYHRVRAGMEITSEWCRCRVACNICGRSMEYIDHM